MRKDILAKAVRLADKTTVKPNKAVMASPKQIKKMPEVYSHRLYTRITAKQAKRLAKLIGVPVSTLLRDLLIQYLDKNDHEHKSKT